MIESRFLGRDIIGRPKCPFCGLAVERPEELDARRPGQLPVGKCGCGAVYACDVTGHNVGNAIIEALVFGCDMDWDLAWNLLPEEDYSQEIVEHYDYESHLIIPGGFYESRRISGVLLFIRFHEDVEEMAGEGASKRLEKAKQRASQSSKQTVAESKKTLSKSEVERFVQTYNFEPILELAGGDKKLIRNLKRLLYTGDDLFRKRAAECLGRVCAIIADSNPGVVTSLLANLFYTITDTAAFTWGAFEAIGEIISHRLDLFAGYAPQLFQFIEDETRRPLVVETIGRISGVEPHLLRKYTLHFFPFLKDPDPDVRGYTAWLLGNLGALEGREDLEKLRDEDHVMTFYEDGNLIKKKVGQVASEAIAKLGV